MGMGLHFAADFKDPRAWIAVARPNVHPQGSDRGAGEYVASQTLVISRDLQKKLQRSTAGPSGENRVITHRFRLRPADNSIVDMIR